MISFNPMMRAISHTAPRLRLRHMTRDSETINRIFSPGTVDLNAQPLTFPIAGEMTAENVGREIVAQLMRGPLGRFVAASDDNRDCIVGVRDPVTVEGNTVILSVAIAREPR